jgi:hypothetical protein
VGDALVTVGMSFNREADVELTDQEARDSCKSNQVGIGIEEQHYNELYISMI